jgi:hypothetical protein
VVVVVVVVVVVLSFVSLSLVAWLLLLLVLVSGLLSLLAQHFTNAGKVCLAVVLTAARACLSMTHLLVPACFTWSQSAHKSGGGWLGA